MAKRKDLRVDQWACVILQQKDKDINFSCLSLHSLVKGKTAGCVCGVTVSLTSREVSFEQPWFTKKKKRYAL